MMSYVYCDVWMCVYIMYTPSYRPWCASPIFGSTPLKPCDPRSHWRKTNQTKACLTLCQTCPATRSSSSYWLCHLALEDFQTFLFFFAGDLRLILLAFSLEGQVQHKTWKQQFSNNIRGVCNRSFWILQRGGLSSLFCYARSL